MIFPSFFYNNSYRFFNIIVIIIVIIIIIFTYFSLGGQASKLFHNVSKQNSINILFHTGDFLKDRKYWGSNV